MSMSLRDQLLQAGLVTQKQVKDAERQRERQARQVPKLKQPSPAVQQPAPPGHAAKTARDQALNRQQQEKAKKKALQAEIKQLIEQNRRPPIEGDDFYNFIDGSKVRHIAVNPVVRAELIRGEIVVVRHEGRYDLVPAAIAVRIRERDTGSVVASAPQESSPTDEAYQRFAVPDDLIW
ncbi:MAG: DUF2058 domain-containing protein [Pseudomonadota bacterium]|nr:DUF2058 domain-containing protein [Pseudomonadota bacterium]